MNLGMCVKPVRARDLGVITHKSEKSTIRCTEPAKSKQGVRYDKEDSEKKQGEKHHIEFV